MNRFEQGVVQDVNLRIERQSLSTVVRDSRGRVTWKLRGNTPEENEQLGIKNIQGLFFERFPEFGELFPCGENQKILEDKREEAGRFIVDRVGEQGEFISVFRKSPLHSRTAPYFPTSHQEVLVKAFSALGLSLEFAQRPNGYWTTIRIEEEARAFLSENNILSENAMLDKNRGDLIAAIRDYPGGLRKLRKKIGGKDLRKPKDFWTEEVIEADVLRFYEQYGSFSRPLLREMDRKDLDAAIKKHYQGGYSRLKEKLNLKGIRKGNGYWTPTNIEKEAMEFYQQFGVLSQDALLEHGRGDLMGGISQYPGELGTLLIKLGIKKEIGSKKTSLEETSIDDIMTAILKELEEEKNE